MATSVSLKMSRTLNSLTNFVLLVSATGLLALAHPKLIEGDGHDSGEGVDFYAVPNLDDAALSAELTRTFQENLLPNLRRGIPEIGVRSIDPVTLPNFTITNFDSGFLRCNSQTHNFVVMGLSNISSSSIVVDTEKGQLTARFSFPKVEGSSRSGTSCFLLGAQLWRLPEGGGIVRYRFDDLTMSGTFKVRPNPGEIVRLERMDLEFKGASARGKGTLPAPIEAVVNILQGEFLGLHFFRFAVRVGLANASPAIFNTFMDQAAWRAVLGDFI